MNLVKRKPDAHISMNAEKVIEQITFTWNKATEFVLEVATLLNSYQSDKTKQQLWYEIRSELINRNIMGKTAISNLCSIGRNQTIYRHIELLPPSFTALTEISRMDEIELEKRFKRGEINSKSLLESVKQLKYEDVIDIDGVEVVEKSVNKKLKSKGITLLFSEKDIISKYETIEKNIKKIKVMMPYVEIEISGTLKKKLTGD